MWKMQSQNALQYQSELADKAEVATMKMKKYSCNYINVIPETINNKNNY